MKKVSFSSEHSAFDDEVFTKLEIAGKNQVGIARDILLKAGYHFRTLDFFPIQDSDFAFFFQLY